MRPLLLALPALLLAVPATAEAALVERRCDPLVPAMDCVVPPIEVTAAPGETNLLTLGHDGAALTVRDTTTPPTAGVGCAQAEPDMVRCEAPPAGLAVTVDAGDGDDVVDATRLTAGEILLDGGAGDDVLGGGSGRDVLRGGAGADILLAGDGDDFLVGDPPDVIASDRLTGGPGRDTAGYEDRRAPLTIDLADPEPDGSPGERDELNAIENVMSGAGDTVLRGDDGPNTLAAPYGNRVVSRVEGRGGDDRLTGRVVDGGDGDDVMSARVRVACGAGTDRIFDPRILAPRPNAECERIDLDGLVVDLTTLAIRGRGIRATAERTERGRGHVLLKAGRRTVARRRVPAGSGPRPLALRGSKRPAALFFDPAAPGVPTRGFRLRR